MQGLSLLLVSVAAVSQVAAGPLSLLPAAGAGGLAGSAAGLGLGALPRFDDDFFDDDFLDDDFFDDDFFDDDFLDDDLFDDDFFGNDFGDDDGFGIGWRWMLRLLRYRMRRTLSLYRYISLLQRLPLMQGRGRRAGRLLGRLGRGRRLSGAGGLRADLILGLGRGGVSSRRTGLGFGGVGSGFSRGLGGVGGGFSRIGRLGSRRAGQRQSFAPLKYGHTYSGYPYNYGYGNAGGYYSGLYNSYYPGSGYGANYQYYYPASKYYSDGGVNGAYLNGAFNSASYYKPHSYKYRSDNKYGGGYSGGYGSKYSGGSYSPYGYYGRR